VIKASYTPAVKKLADQIGKLDIGELLALRESCKQYFDIGDDDGAAGVREPLNPDPHDKGGAIHLTEPRESDTL